MQPETDERDINERIYEELVLIRKELQAIRGSEELLEKYKSVRENGKVIRKPI